MKRASILFSLILLTGYLSGCSGNNALSSQAPASQMPSSVAETSLPNESNTPPATIQTPNGESHIAQGQSLTLLATGFKGQIIWSSSDPYCVSVNEYGEISGGHKGGSVAIIARHDGQEAQLEIENHVVMRDITSAELVSELKFGGDWNDQVTLYKRELPEIVSTPISFGISLWEPSTTDGVYHEGQPIMKGQAVKQQIELKHIPDELLMTPLSAASVNFSYAGDGKDEQDIRVTISNARITTITQQVYELPYMNGTHKLFMAAAHDPEKDLWFCNNAVGDMKKSGLPLPGELRDGVFTADVLLEQFNSDFTDTQRFMCASTGGDIPIAKEMVREAKQQGYDYLRIPFTFSNFMDDAFLLNPAWLDELEQVVNLVMDEGLYCLIDPSDDYGPVSWVGDHYERNWLADTCKDYVDKRYQAAWKQIAERFKTYDDYLLFGNFNEFNGEDGLDNDEPFDNSRFSPSRQELNRLNEMTELFVKTVVETGGNNTGRHLYVSGWNGAWEENVLAALKLPDYDRLIGSVHYYFYEDWGDEYVSSWSSSRQKDTAQVDRMFDNLEQAFLAQGIPVIMTEFGSREYLPMEDRIDQATYILKKALALGIPCTWFEGGGWYSWENGESFALFDRKQMKWQYPELQHAMKDLYSRAP